MTVNFQPVSYPIFGGVDKKISGNVLPAPKLQRAENVWSDQTGSLRRRFGRAELSNLTQESATITGWNATASYQGRVVGFANNALYDYGEDSGRWVPKDRATSWRETTENISSPSNTQVPAGGAMDVAATTGYRMYGYDVYETIGANIKTTTMLSLTGADGVKYVVDFALTTATAAAAQSSGMRVCAFGARLYAIYFDYTTAGTLKCFIIDTTSAATIATSLGTVPTTLTTTLEPIVTINYPVFDACDNTVSGPFLAYRTTTANTIGFGFVNTSGALVSTSTTSSGAADPNVISVAVAPGSALHAITFSLSTTPDDVYAHLRSWNGSAWSVIASSGALATLLTATVRHHACIFDSTTVLRVFYDGDLNTVYGCIRQSTFDTSSVASLFVMLLPRSYMASKPFRGSDSVIYYWVTNEPSQDTVQPTLFLMTYNGTLVGVASQGIAAFQNLPYLSHVVTVGTAYIMVTQYYTNIGSSITTSTGALRELSIDMAPPESHVCVEDGSCLYVPSSILQQYDGQSCTEVGFLTFVNTSTRITIGAAQITNGAGSLTNAANTVYSYRIVQEWTNAQGEREQGTDAGAKTTLAADWVLNDDTVTFTIDCVPWTLKGPIAAAANRYNLVFAVYRTTANPTVDSPHYRVGTIANDRAADTVTFVDTMSDVIAAQQEQLYADSELSNLGPPPGFILAAGNGRVYMAGLPDDPTLVNYSKLRGHGQPLTFNPALQIQMPQSTGDITSLAVLDEQVVAFTADAVYRVVGEGANNVGLGAGFASPVVATADGGARGHRGVAVTPIGLVYQTTRGIMVFSPSLKAGYLGAPLEGFGDVGLLVGVTAQPARQLIHFAFASVTHVYDYYHQQWYVWTHHSDGPTCLWNDVVVALTDDIVQYGSETAWTDGGDTYAATVVLGWQRNPATMMGDLAFRRVALVGNSLDTHYLDIQLAHDYSGTTNQTTDSTIVAAGVLRTSIRVGRQKANSIQVTIRDAILDIYGADVVLATAGWRLNEVTLEIGTRGNLSGRRVA